ncbi:hypothetical protein A306_00000477, partial [Columba livia]
MGDTGVPPGADFTACHPSQLLRSSYVFLFQLPWLPELLLALADFQLIRTVLTSPWSGIRDPARRLSSRELECYLFGLAQPGGLSPPVHYYRNLFRLVVPVSPRVPRPIGVSPCPPASLVPLGCPRIRPRPSSHWLSPCPP